MMKVEQRNGRHCIVNSDGKTVTIHATEEAARAQLSRLTARERIAAVGCFVANEFTAEDECWALLSPFGRFPNTQGLQVFNAADARAIANEFHGLLGTPQRVMGIPFYIGHPDHPLFKDRYKDTRAYGRIKALECREDLNCPTCSAFANSRNGEQPCVTHGLWAKVKWNEDGKRLIANESFAGHSVNWRLKKGADGCFHPFSLKSVGFTNEPNIPVPSIMAGNEDEDNFVNGEELRMIHFRKLAGIRLMANSTVVKAYTRRGPGGSIVTVKEHPREGMGGGGPRNDNPKGSDVPEYNAAMRAGAKERRMKRMAKMRKKSGFANPYVGEKEQLSDREAYAKWRREG